MSFPRDASINNHSRGESADFKPTWTYLGVVKSTSGTSFLLRDEVGVGSLTHDFLIKWWSTISIRRKRLLPIPSCRNDVVVVLMYVGGGIVCCRGTATYSGSRSECTYSNCSSASSAIYLLLNLCIIWIVYTTIIQIDIREWKTLGTISGDSLIAKSPKIIAHFGRFAVLKAHHV